MHSQPASPTNDSQERGQQGQGRETTAIQRAEAERETEIETETETKTDRQKTDRQTNRQTDKQTAKERE
eukprot:COSAG03_NODE_12210_length_557_cov_0.585153_1_plen_68_part_10